LKTALLRHVQKFGADDVPLLAASYQEAIVGAVAERTRTALRRGRYRSLIVGGGVSLNSRLRAALSAVAEDAGVRILLAKPKYCGDNAAMIAALAFYRRNVSGEAAMLADVAPSL
ncbi:MAG: tRNA (adenosine(37)-N6)-threonylcarbamoyltransferase complex transferase subunit TsaD, partial [Kiritimatiellae bacterium]|nr:tRNA (adenosine(37)-N6)-threonylcarbamoyltransferase complex transferase subunit TsaD [Kiritimatiellia bacterium]